MVSAIEAEMFVKNSYPDAYLFKYCVGRKTGTMYSIYDNPIEYKLIASIFRPYDHSLSRYEFIELVWNQARFKIMNDMLKKLES
jgi:hypothetical protein